MPENSRSSANVHFAVGHQAAEGHFPGNPIIPGAVLLREIVAAVGGGDAAICQDIRSAKFHYPVRPGDTLEVRWTADAGDEIRFSCSVAGSGRPAVTGTLRLSSS